MAFASSIGTPERELCTELAMDRPGRTPGQVWAAADVCRTYIVEVAVIDRTLVRAAVALVSGCLASCDNWPVQKDKDGSVGGGEVPQPRDAAGACTLVAPVQISASPQVNGGLCFGIARGSSDTLQCGPSATGNVTQCVDALLNSSYLVRWNGNSATVTAAFDGQQLGSVQLITNNTFEITTAGALMGTCTLTSGPSPGVELCRD